MLLSEGLTLTYRDSSNPQERGLWMIKTGSFSPRIWSHHVSHFFHLSAYCDSIFHVTQSTNPLPGLHHGFISSRLWAGYIFFICYTVAGIAMEDRLLMFGTNYEIPRGVGSHLGGALRYFLQKVHKSHTLFFSNIFIYSLNIHACIRYALIIPTS